MQCPLVRAGDGELIQSAPIWPQVIEIHRVKGIYIFLKPRIMLKFNLQELSNPHRKDYFIIKPCKSLPCFSFGAAISTPPAFILSYLRHSLCSVYIHLRLFLTQK